MKRKVGAFTLIELMICIAILAIILIIPMTAAGSLHWLSREKDYRFALRNARHQLGTLRKTPLDDLPPQTLVVGSQGWVQLAHSDIVPDSVVAAGQPPLEVDAEHGRVRLSSAQGSKVIVDYHYYVADQGEAHTIPANAPFQANLTNSPVRRIVSVQLAQGQQLTPLSPAKYRLDQASGTLDLDPALAGKVIVIEYLGERIRNQVSGQFLNADLLPDSQAGPAKLMRIQESYGPGQQGQMSLTLVKTGDKP